VSPRPKTLTIQETADQLNVHYMTAYRYIRQGLLPATRQGTQWRVQQADLDAMRKSTGSRKRRPRRSEVDSGAFERTLLAGDSAGAWWLIESHLGSGLNQSGVLTELVAPALSSIGDRWAKGDISVADEHRSTAVALRVIGRLGLQWGRPGKDRGTIALAAVAGDRHALPVAIVADLLRWQRFAVLELGADTPADDIGYAIANEQRLLAVGLCSTTSGLDAAVRKSVRAVRASVPGVPIFVGGAAMKTEAQAISLGADMWTGSNAQEVLDAVECLVSNGAASDRPGVDGRVAS
jgi:excisionase family DNA binding protein